MRLTIILFLVILIAVKVCSTHAAEPQPLHFQCGDYAPYPHVTWYECGPTVRVKGAAVGGMLRDMNPPIVHTPYPVPTETKPAASDHQPPRFLPAVVLYDKDNRFLAIEVGKTFAYTCKAALDDASATIEKATAAGRRLVGLCIPVPTYSAADLMPAADPPKATPDNSL